MDMGGITTQDIFHYRPQAGSCTVIMRDEPVIDHSYELSYKQLRNIKKSIVIDGIVFMGWYITSYYRVSDMFLAHCGYDYWILYDDHIRARCHI